MQAVLGAIEVVGGAGLVGVGGAATPAGGSGLVVAGVGAWLVWNGHDNAVAGVHALITGEPKPTSLNKLLRGLGLSGPDADAAELYLGLAGGAGSARVGRAAVEKAARRELARRALLAFDTAVALRVTAPDGRSLWSVADIRLRGDLWEAFDAKRTGFRRTPHAAAFDQVSADGSVAISNKTLDLQRETCLRTDRRALYHKVKGYIDDAFFGMPRHPNTREPLPLAKREVRVLLRHGDSVPGQALQLAAAEEYARSLGVKLVIEYAF